MKQRTPRRTPSRGGKGGWEPPARIRARERRAMELAVLGSTQHEIATVLQISQPAVSKLLARADERALADLSSRVERQKVRQTQRLERVFAEAMQAWERSKADTTKRRQRQSAGDGGTNTGPGNHTVAEVVVETKHGDPRYLETARKAMGDLRSIWGLDAPQQVDISRADPYAGLTEAELLERIAEQDALLQHTGTAARQKRARQ
jgi:predicted transcriptional regulator